MESNSVCLELSNLTSDENHVLRKPFSISTATSSPLVDR